MPMVIRKINPILKKEAFESLEIKSDDFLFNAELLAKTQIKRLSIAQVGVEHYPRAKGKSGFWMN